MEISSHTGLHAVPEDFEVYRTREHARAAANMRRGWSQAYARQNQLLPYAGTSLSAGDAARIDRLIARLCRQVATEGELSGAILASMVMTTGRPLSILTTAAIGETGAPEPREPTLVVGDKWTWWLKPGEPSSPQINNKGQADRPRLIPLPCSIRTRQLIERLGLTLMPRRISSMFPLSDSSFRTIVCKTMRDAGVSAPVSFLEKWLFDRMVQIDGGDIAFASLVTGYEPVSARTVVHYTRLEPDAVPGLLTAALHGFDDLPDQFERSPLPLGSRFAPVMTDVKRLSAGLATPLKRSSRVKARDVIATHNAMTTYTALLTFFSTGCRPSGSLIPELDHIDPATGFMIVDDKTTHDNFKTRIVWVSEMCREQLDHYRRHIDALSKLRPDIDRSSVAGAPFLLKDKRGVRALRKRDLTKAIAGHEFPFPLNSGRHFLRSSLAGRIRDETLNAFLGHWHLGTEPWSAKSGLDPMRYRAELASVLPSLLSGAGWHPQKGLA